MKYSDYLKNKKSEKRFFFLQIVAKIILVISLFVFVLGFVEPGLIAYRNFYGKSILPFLILALIIREIFSIDSKKSKMCRYLSYFEKTLTAQEITPSYSSEPVYEYLCTTYSKNKIKEWIEHYVDIAIKNFREDKSLSLYSLVIFEKEIKNNWEKYKGRRVSTVGFALSSAYTFTFIAYPLFQDTTESIDSNRYIYEKIEDNNFLHIKYHQLVFRTKESLPLRQMNEMTNIQYFISDYKQSEFDPGTKVILNGTLDMDEKGNLTIINCEVTKYTKDIRERIREEQLKQ